MNKKDEIKKILPKIGSENQNELRQKSPRIIMQEFGDVIDENYKGYLKSFITETSKIDEEGGPEILCYSFYLIAFIGKGYNYKLFEAVPKWKDVPYPVNVILFERHPSNEGEFDSELSFYNKLMAFFQSGFFSNVVNNLSVQVDLYRESRNSND